VSDAAQWAGSSEDYVAQALLAAVAGLCGQGVSARITEAWSEPVILWQALVGGPSCGKTPALEWLRRPLGGGWQPDLAGAHRGRRQGHKYCLVMEPDRDGDKVVTSRKGVGRFVMTVRGRASHAGVRHEDGRSAILEMAQQILRI
jgi:hypothetical protein